MELRGFTAKTFRAKAFRAAAVPVLAAAAVGGLALPASAAPAATSPCQTFVDGNTGGAVCSGYYGTWRVHVSCYLAPDAYTSWFTQAGGTVGWSAACPFWSHVNYVSVEFL